MLGVRWATAALRPAPLPVGRCRAWLRSDDRLDHGYKLVEAVEAGVTAWERTLDDLGAWCSDAEQIACEEALPHERPVVTPVRRYCLGGCGTLVEGSRCNKPG